MTSLLLGLTTLVPLACSSSHDPSGHAPEGLRDGAFDGLPGTLARDSAAPVSNEDLAVIIRAEQRAMTACMAARGFDADVIGVDTVVTRAPLFLSPAELRRSGYQYDWEKEGSSYLALNGPGGPPSPTKGMTPVQVAAYMRADGGDPNARVEIEDEGGGRDSMSTGGCTGEARAKLYGSVRNALRFYRAEEQVSGNGLSSVLRRQRPYVAAVRRWDACMRSAGVPVRDSEDYGQPYLVARLDSGLGEGKPALSSDEITAVARRDAACQESSGLYVIRRRLLPKAMKDLASQLGFELQDYYAFQHAVLERAKKVP